MASQGCETLAYDVKIKGDNLLMTLMEELPCDENDDERLDSLIRSFEAEISESKMGGHDDSTSIELLQMKSNFEESYNESCNIGQVDEFGVEWVDMDLIPSFQFDDGSWECFGDEKDVMVDHLMVCDDGFNMEEEHGYNSFWQDNYEMGLVH
ncbi:unnamed protein product [Lathyrus oleraceus]